MPDQQHVLAAFKQRIAGSLHDYADQAERGRTPDPLGADADVLRGVRFAAELVAGRVHNPHAGDCACPCDKPDPALLPAPPHPTAADMAALTQMIADSGLDPESAALAAKVVLTAGYRAVPTSMPPGPPHQPRTDVELPGYLQPEAGGFVLQVPCRGCNAWHMHEVGQLMAGDRVKVSLPCAASTSAEGRRVVQPEPVTVTVVVQAAWFNRVWHRGGQVTRAYWALWRG